MNYLKLIMAALLLACLLHMPYGFYVLVRFVAMVVFAVLAVQYSEKRNSALMVTFGALARVCQRFFKIALGRGMWSVVDVVVAILLVALCIKERNNA